MMMRKYYRIIVIWASICYTSYQNAETPTVPNTGMPSDPAAVAKLIVDSNRAELIVMRIIPFRNLDDRKKINDQVKTLGVTALVDETYMLGGNLSIPYLDLCYVLLFNDKVKILSKYLVHFLDIQDENTIVVIMLLVDNMPEFKKAYDDIPDVDSLDKGCENQRKPFQNMLKVWTNSNREPDGKVDPAEVDKKVGLLQDEKPKWDETRDQLENVFMNCSYPMVKAVIEKYEANNKHPIEDDIKATIKNADLVDAYSSLATYVKDKYTCLATKLHDHSDSQDNWVVWNTLIAILKPDDWKQIDASFKKQYNTGVVDFISHNILGDFVLMETFAYLLDSSYKPKFLEVPAPIAQAAPPPAPGVQPASPGNTPPAVPPTTVVPPSNPASAPAPAPAG